MTKIASFFQRIATGQPVDQEPASAAAQQILIVGTPNVGKSAMFNWLTGRYVTVSNYPGTTVEISRGRSKHFDDDCDIIDTPGMYSLLPITDEERVARAMLLSHTPRAVIHVIDAKNINRMLGLTLQLIEARLPVVLALNLYDEAQAAGVQIDTDKLEAILGIPVVATVATSGKGLGTLVERIKGLNGAVGAASVDYGAILELAIAAISQRLDPAEGIGPRTRALMLLHGDHEENQRLHARGDSPAAQEVARIVFDACSKLRHTAHYHTSLSIKAHVDAILPQCVQFPPRRPRAMREAVSRLLINPWTGFPILLAVLYFGLYKFVGDFGAGTLVKFLEEDVFGRWCNPVATSAVKWAIPWPVVQDLFIGDFGIITLGLRYAVAIVLPIVGTFFLAFSMLEDSGYLPRLAMLIDRVFKRIGLNGRAVIPMVLGFGCDTMATLVTRTLETKRERVIATFLLALAIPCSAQLGVILGLLAGHPAALALWAGVIVAVFLGAGLMASKFLPGERPSFYMELPPLRLPRPVNVLIKTYTRMVWYFKEIMPLFILASVLIWIGQLTGIFQLLITIMQPLVRAIGLPNEAAAAFLFGFFRRDYGIAGLYDLHQHGGLVPNQLAVASVTLTLFLPCIAQFLVMKKERGLKMTLLVSAFIAVFAFAMGFVVNLALNLLGVQL